MQLDMYLQGSAAYSHIDNCTPSSSHPPSSLENCRDGRGKAYSAVLGSPDTTQQLKLYVISPCYKHQTTLPLRHHSTQRRGWWWNHWSLRQQAGGYRSRQCRSYCGGTTVSNWLHQFVVSDLVHDVSWTHQSQPDLHRDMKVRIK